MPDDGSDERDQDEKDEYEWPDDRPPDAPDLFIQLIDPDWEKPTDVNPSKRAYRVERYVMSEFGYIADHEPTHDCIDPDATINDKIEVTHTLRNYANDRTGRLRVTSKQQNNADRLHWIVLQRDKWRILWQAETDIRLIKSVFDTYQTHIPWTVLLDYLEPDADDHYDYMRQFGWIEGATHYDERKWHLTEHD